MIKALYFNTEDFYNEIQTYKNKDELVKFIKNEVAEWACLDENEEPTVIATNSGRGGATVYSTEEFGDHHLWILIKDNK